MPETTFSHGLLLFAANLLAGLTMLALFTRLYLWVTPYDEANEIKQGHVAPAIVLCGAMLGFTFPLLAASFAQSGILDFIAWGIIACVVQIVVFWALHWLLPRLIETNNPAGALCFASASICSGLLTAASLIP
jgi:putative membrane protein